MFTFLSITNSEKLEVDCCYMLYICIIRIPRCMAKVLKSINNEIIRMVTSTSSNIYEVKAVGKTNILIPIPTFVQVWSVYSF